MTHSHDLDVESTRGAVRRVPGDYGHEQDPVRCRCIQFTACGLNIGGSRYEIDASTI